MITTLVVGATGATGRLLVEQLLDRGHLVRVIVRNPERLPREVREHRNLTMICAAVLKLTEAELAEHTQGCDAIASCLGHNLTVKGLFGPPYRLVAETTRRLCKAIETNNPKAPVRVVLMSTAANRNRDLSEPLSFSEKCILGLIRWLVPPQTDNENAADYFRLTVGQHSKMIQWVAVRPDTLINQPAVSEYGLHSSPTRSPIFNAGRTTRINVAHFMAELMTNADTWMKWQGQMPVIYNKTQSGAK